MPITKLWNTWIDGYTGTLFLQNHKSHDNFYFIIYTHKQKYGIVHHVKAYACNTGTLLYSNTETVNWQILMSLIKMHDTK
jgi:hypothetical protein